MIGEVRHQTYNLLNPFVPGGKFVPVSSETASNPSLGNFDPRVGLAFDPSFRSQDFDLRQLRHAS